MKGACTLKWGMLNRGGVAERVNSIEGMRVIYVGAPCAAAHYGMTGTLHQETSRYLIFCPDGITKGIDNMVVTQHAERFYIPEQNPIV